MKTIGCVSLGACGAAPHHFFDWCSVWTLPLVGQYSTAERLKASPYRF